jgi:hypothetical protein
MTSEATFFIDDVAVTARELEVVGASFDNGMNLAGSNACGIGINMNEGAVVGTPEQFTLLDQHGNAREAQISQHIGGSGLGDGSSGTQPDAVVRFGDSPTQAAKDADTALDGTITTLGNSTLTTLGAGWVVNV